MPCVSYEDAVEEALCFGWIDGKVKRVDDATYVTRFTPRKPNSIWSLSNKRRVERLIAEGSMTPAGQALVDQAKKSGAWERAEQDLQEFAAPPSELALEFAQDKSARSFYNSMTAAQRRDYNRWVGTAKRADTRKRRARSAAQRCSKGLKPGM